MEAAPRGGLGHPAQGLVAEDQTLPAPGRGPVLAGHDLLVRAANADGDGLDHYGAVLGGLLGDVRELGAPGAPRYQGDGPHGYSFLALP